jgi:hypothetical protein
MPRKTSRYALIIERIFRMHYRAGAEVVEFTREDIPLAAEAEGVKVPKNFGDVVYSYKFRKHLPDYIVAKRKPGKDWMIAPAGRSRYRFILSELTVIKPTNGLTETCVPDAAPGMVTMYALSDEQALLAKLRYNRLIDIFTGVTCYSVQNHLRTTVEGMGQIETDELYVGIDRKGAHYVIPVQAKGDKDWLHVVQILQDIGMCSEKFANLICRPIAAQFMGPDLIALFELEMSGVKVKIARERHYRLVPADEAKPEDFEPYRLRSDD